jgi:hypothetical protein
MFSRREPEPSLVWIMAKLFFWFSVIVLSPTAGVGLLVGYLIWGTR